jgi:hypothetical protein
MATGTCTVHSWNDGAEEDEAEPKMGLRVDQKLEADPALYGAAPVGGFRAVPRIDYDFDSEDEDEDDDGFGVDDFGDGEDVE